MDILSQKIILEAKSQPALVVICQLLEGVLVDFKQKLEKKMPGKQSFRKKVSEIKKGCSSDMTVVQNEVDDLKEPM